MRNLLSKGLVVAAGIAGFPAMAAPPELQPVEKAQIRSSEDPRVSSVRRFFQRTNSPAQHLSDVFIREADNNGLDWRLLPGLALVESGGGKHCQKFNLFGWMNGKASFESFTDGIRQVAWHLSNSRYYRNKSLPKMLLTYNKNPMYRVKVMSVMRLISPSVEIPVTAE
jgi:hypothetical protein